MLLLVVVAFFVLSIFLGSFFTVQTAQVAIVQRLGKFARVAGPGLNWKTPFLETVVQRMSMKVQQFEVQVETKTQDNVFVQIPAENEIGRYIFESGGHCGRFARQPGRFDEGVRVLDRESFDFGHCAGPEGEGGDE
jgi:hypothetical protein